MHMPYSQVVTSPSPSDFDVYVGNASDSYELLLTRSLSKGDDDDEPTGVVEATVTSSVVNLTNSIVGSGILGLPYAFAPSGWVLSYVLLAMASMATVFSLHILSECCTRVSAPATFYRSLSLSSRRKDMSC